MYVTQPSIRFGEKPHSMELELELGLCPIYGSRAGWGAEGRLMYHMCWYHVFTIYLTKVRMTMRKPRSEPFLPPNWIGSVDY